MEKRSVSKKARLEPFSSTKEPLQGEADDSKTLLAYLDLDMLECPLCFAPFDAAIFQCKNGHATCETCCSRINGVCSYCGEPIGDIRCRPLENAIAAMMLPCAFAMYGCTRRVWHTDKRDHEARCLKAPCACPIDGCAYSGGGLYNHISQSHSRGDAASFFPHAVQVMLNLTMPFRVLRNVEHKRVFLLINGGGIPTGRSLSVVCIGHPPDGNKALSYTMAVSAGGSAAAPSLSLSGPVTYIRQWPEHRSGDEFLFVPDAYWSSFGYVTVMVMVYVEDDA